MGVPRGGRPPTYLLSVELASIRGNPYLPTPATLTYHKRKVRVVVSVIRSPFRCPALASVSLSGDSGAVSVIGSW